jgi:hypothetical protein
VITKLVPAVRVVIVYVRPVVVLQVTESAVPSVESSITMISLFAVTAVVATVTVVAAAAMLTRPAEAAAQVPPELAQFVVVAASGNVTVPVKVGEASGARVVSVG